MHLSQLIKYYFIDDFNPIHLKDLDKNVNLIWRNKNTKENLNKIYQLTEFCRRNKLKLFFANDVRLAMKLGLNGAYISAHNKAFRFNSYNFKKGFKIIGSAHNIFEVNIKKKQKISEIFISPMFKYKHKNPLGIHKIKFFPKDKKLKKIALGGVSEKNIGLLKLVKFDGFAGINIFKKKGPKNLGPF